MRRHVLLWLLSPVLAACGRRRAKPKPAPPADYTPPQWVEDLHAPLE